MTSEVFFANIQSQLDSDLPFVAYRKPNETTLKALLQTSDEMYQINGYSESGFVFAPFDSDKDSILIPISKSELLQCEFNTSAVKETNKSIISEEKEARKNHISLVQKGVDAINSDQFQKVVLSRKEEIKVEEANSIEIFKKLLNKYETAFVYLFFHPKVGLWLGATPETLLKIEGNQLTTMSLAGTQKFDGILNVDWQEKEREEQQFVTDFIVNSLERLTENVSISNTETVRAGNLLHLKTTITARLSNKESNLKELLQDLHPTPAVCGLPKNAAKQFILKNEGYHREFYTGFLGELNLMEKKSRNPNRQNVENDAYAVIKTVSNLFVNLRCMQLKNHYAYIYVGGGITKDSDAEKEWEETVIKSETMKRILTF
ncbi:chorismate-binding protein [Subsaxibacter sp. CAU 1640]|nr:chorismate-binding protein [Subsaxibacter sp. CAU 1640]MCK7590562.1 chorismate-binding protein [Subsaxibacter sp. CAU 1640]